jgi:hypothetical protein
MLRQPINFSFNNNGKIILFTFSLLLADVEDSHVITHGCPTPWGGQQGHLPIYLKIIFWGSYKYFKVLRHLGIF